LFNFTIFNTILPLLEHELREIQLVPSLTKPIGQPHPAVMQFRSQTPLLNKFSQVSTHSTHGVNTNGAGHGNSPTYFIPN